MERILNYPGKERKFLEMYYRLLARLPRSFSDSIREWSREHPEWILDQPSPEQALFVMIRQQIFLKEQAPLKQKLQKRNAGSFIRITWLYVSFSNLSSEMKRKIHRTMITILFRYAILLMVLMVALPEASAVLYLCCRPYLPSMIVRMWFVILLTMIVLGLDRAFLHWIKADLIVQIAGALRKYPCLVPKKDPGKDSYVEAAPAQSQA